MNRIVRSLIVVALLGLVLTLALAFRRDPHDIRTGTVGKPAPAFAAARLDGTGDLSLGQYAGKVVVLNFFASWCEPCTQENPALVRVYERYRGTDVVMIGVNYQETRDNGLGYVRRMGISWPTVANTSTQKIATGTCARPLATAEPRGRANWAPSTAPPKNPMSEQSPTTAPLR